MEMYQVVSLLVAGGAFVGAIVFGVATSLKWWGKRAYRKLFPSELLYTVLYAVPIWLIYSAYSNLHLFRLTIVA